MTTYKNKFYETDKWNRREFLQAEVKPVVYRGFNIYHRIKAVTKWADEWDIVKDGECIGMCAGLGGAKQKIDRYLAEEEEAFALNEGVRVWSFSCDR